MRIYAHICTSMGLEAAEERICNWYVFCLKKMQNQFSLDRIMQLDGISWLCPRDKHTSDKMPQHIDSSDALCIILNRHPNAQYRFCLEIIFYSWVYAALKESFHLLSLYPCRSLPKKVSLFFLQNYLFFLTQRRVLCHCFLYNIDGFHVEWVLGFS